MEFTKRIAVPLKNKDGEYLLSQKKWHPLLFAACVQFAAQEQDEDGNAQARLEAQEFLDICTGDFKFSDRKAKEQLEFMCGQGVMERDKTDIVIPLFFKGNCFVTMGKGGWQYLYDEMEADRMAACAYVILSYERLINGLKRKSEQGAAPWRFSVGGKTGNGLMRMCGYSPDNFNGKEKMKNILSKFEEDGILSASQPKTLTIHGRKAGKYRELWDFHDPKSKTSGEWVFIEEEQKDAWQAFLDNPDSPYRAPSPQMRELGNKMQQLHYWMMEMDKLCQLWMDEE